MGYGGEKPQNNAGRFKRPEIAKLVLSLQTLSCETLSEVRTTNKQQ